MSGVLQGLAVLFKVFVDDVVSGSALLASLPVTLSSVVWLLYSRVGLPSRETLTVWRVGPITNSVSSTKSRARSFTWIRITQIKNKGRVENG